MASVMGTEAAVLRMQFVSGTHAIATALFACLRPGDCLLAVAGRYGPHSLDASILLSPCLRCSTSIAYLICLMRSTAVYTLDMQQMCLASCSHIVP